MVGCYERRGNRIKLLNVFFPADDGIRDTSVTGVQTCALPIFKAALNFCFTKLSLEVRLVNSTAGSGGSAVELFSVAIFCSPLRISSRTSAMLSSVGVTAEGGDRKSVV